MNARLGEGRVSERDLRDYEQKCPSTTSSSSIARHVLGIRLGPLLLGELQGFVSLGLVSFNSLKMLSEVSMLEAPEEKEKKKERKKFQGEYQTLEAPLSSSQYIDMITTNGLLP